MLSKNKLGIIMIAFLYSNALQDIRPQTGDAIGPACTFEPQIGFPLCVLAEEPSWEQRLDDIRRQLEAIEQRLLQIQRELEEIQHKLNDIAEKLIALQQSLAERITSHVPIIQAIKTFDEMKVPPESIVLLDIDDTLGRGDPLETVLNIVEAPKRCIQGTMAGLFAALSPFKEDRRQAREDRDKIYIKHEEFQPYSDALELIKKWKGFNCCVWAYTNVASANSGDIYDKLKKVGIECTPFLQDNIYLNDYADYHPRGYKGIFFNDKGNKKGILVDRILPWIREHYPEQLKNGLIYADDLAGNLPKYEDLISLQKQWDCNFPALLYHIQRS